MLTMPEKIFILDHFPEAKQQLSSIPGHFVVGQYGSVPPVSTPPLPHRGRATSDRLDTLLRCGVFMYVCCSEPHHSFGAVTPTAIKQQ